jgi:hypothetical protein
MHKSSLSSPKEDTTHYDVEYAADKILPAVAKVRLSKNKMQKIGACQLYDIAEGWEKQTLLRDEMVSKVFTTRDLDRALRHPDQELILIPRQSGINRKAVTQLCERNTLVKTIYYEGVTTQNTQTESKK